MAFRDKSTLKTLALEYKSLQEEPAEGFRVKLVDENFFEWELGIYCPPDTIFSGGYYKARMKFPKNYPFAPPSLKFVTEMWHPNVFRNGLVCFEILHNSANIFEQIATLCKHKLNARTAILSVISLLNDPYPDSAADDVAAEMYIKWRDSKGKNNDYPNKIREIALATNAEARKEGIIVPTTIEEYCIKPMRKSTTETTVDAHSYDELVLKTEDGNHIDV